MSVYVGIDVHRKRSQVAVVTEDGQVQLNKNVGQRIHADAAAYRRSAIGDTGGVRGPVRLGLAGPAAGGLRLRGASGASAAVQAIASARLKNDKVDAAILAQLLRADLLPEAWIAPPQVR